MATSPTMENEMDAQRTDRRASTAPGGIRIVWRSEENESSDETADSSDEDTKEAVEKAQTIRQSFSRPKPWMLAFGFVLAACAGIVNVTAFEELNGTLVSHLTGALSKTAMELEGVQNLSRYDPQSACEHALVILSFVFGAFLCGLAVDKNHVHFGGKAFYGVALIGNSMLLCAATAAAPHRSAAYLAACACGLQNAMCTSHFGAVVRTTHVTGSFTDIGSTGGRIVAILLRRRLCGIRNEHVDQAEIWVDKTKLCILLLLVSGFFSGCVLGSYLYMYAFGVFTWLVPAGVTFAMGVAEMLLTRQLAESVQKQEDRQFRREIQTVESHIEKAAEIIRRRKAHAEVRDVPSTSPMSPLSTTSIDMESEIRHCLEIVREFSRLELLYGSMGARSVSNVQ